MKKQAFTLIELLVVVAIIVVLLALLVPAMDKALYQAEMAVCAAQLRGIGSGAQMYAADFKRYYPHREGLAETSSYSPDTIARDNYDDRVKIRPYMAPKIFVDPLTESVDLGFGEPGTFPTDPGGYFYATYHLWYGWNWREPTPMRGMKKIGDRFVWDGLDAQGNDRLYSFSYLAGDHDYVDQDGGSTHGSHSDRDGVMFNLVLQNADFSGVSEAAFAMSAGRKVTLSRWQSITTSERGDIDMNFVNDDGSVVRFDGVTYDEGNRNERFTLANEVSTGNLTQQKIQLPVQR